MKFELTRDDLNALVVQLMYSYKQINTDMCHAYDEGHTGRFIALGELLDRNLCLEERLIAILEGNK